MIDPVTGWSKIVQYNYKHVDTIANLLEQEWICIYPRPTKIKYDCRNEFLGHTFKIHLVQKDYKINPKCAAVVNM